LIPEKLPNTVHFQAIDDETFYFNTWKSNYMEKFDVIVFNFAINERKAKFYAKEMLEENGRLFAPVNVQSDYWLKQAFRVYDAKGNVLWNVNDVGAWSVQFQPDV
jgi:protein-L-isoaspartate O-methyltransferase